MGRIGVALALLVGWMSVAHADKPYCAPAELEFGRDEVERDPESSDTTPPAKPQITELTLSANHIDSEEMFAIRGTFDPDTATFA